ncbi:MAG: cupin-like domain-containing protein [Alphaproteobacteria bacterium]|nr:cupin-like domain-containing protein [Alphaproteobacteria bacterium]
MILTGEMQEWPALTLWTPQHLREAVGSKEIEYQGGRTKNDRFEMQKDLHRKTMPFDQYIDLIEREPGNDAYITAYNCERNRAALAVLEKDTVFLDKFLARQGSFQSGMMWIGPPGTVTSLHHDLTDNFIAQVVGRKRFKIVPAADVGKLYNHKHVFSQVPNLEDPNLDRAAFPLLDQIRVYDVTIMPGEILYMPLAWWHQVHAIDFSVTITCTNFVWPNDAYKDYPAD